MKINLYVFIFIYLIILCLLPMSMILLIKQSPLSRKSHNFSLLVLQFWLMAYLLTTVALTLLSVSITRHHIIFQLPKGQAFFGFNYSVSLTINNLVLNFALTFPLGLIMFCYYHIKDAFRLSAYKNNSPYKVCFFIGLSLGVAIELLQGILPTGRVVDPVDVLLDALFPLLIMAVLKTQGCVKG